MVEVLFAVNSKRRGCQGATWALPWVWYSAVANGVAMSWARPAPVSSATPMVSTRVQVVAQDWPV